MNVGELKQWLHDQGGQTDDFEVLIYNDEADDYLSAEWCQIKLRKDIRNEVDD